MGINSLIARLERRSAAPCETRLVMTEVSAYSAPVVACTPETCETSQAVSRVWGVDEVGLAVEETENRAVLHTGSAADHCDWDARWDVDPQVSAVHENALFIRRICHAMHLGLPAPEAGSAAALLQRRDRDHDDRRLCVECRHCKVTPRCAYGYAVVDVLQRCDRFDEHMERMYI